MAQTITIDGIDVTDNSNVHVEWTATELGNSIADGSSSLGQVVVKGNEQWLANNLGAAAHKVVEWTVDGIPLARGRVLSVQVERGPLRADRDTQWTFSVGDYNDDLRGLRLLSSQSRPIESDVDRVLWVLGLLANGDPRADTVLDTSGVIVANEVDMDAKVYPVGTELTEILDECKDIAGKTYGVMVDGTFLYIVPGDVTTYVSDLSISDRPTEVDNDTVWAPDKIGGVPFSSESGDVVSDVIFKYGGAEAFVTSTSPHTGDVYWAELAEDSDITSETMAQGMADAIVNSHDDDARTYSYAIRPLPASKLGDIMAGQVISQKARAIPDSDDAATFPRIVELRWQYVQPEQWIAIVRAGRPLRLIGYHRKRGEPHPPNPGTPGSGDTLFESLNWDSGEEQWDHPYGGDSGNVLARSTYFSGGANGTTHGGNFGSLGYSAPRLAVPASARMRISAYSEGFGQSWPCTPFGVINFSWGVQFYDASDVLISTVTVGTHTTAQDSGYVGPDEQVIDIPAGAAYLLIASHTDPSLGCQQNATHIDQLLIYALGTDATAGDDPPPASDDQVGSIGHPGTCYATCDHKHPAQAASVTAITDAGDFYDAGNVEEALQEIASTIAGGPVENSLVDLVHGERDSYLAPAFQAGDESLFVLTSDDGKTWTELHGNAYNPTGEFVRDPSLMVREGKWWVVHTRGPAGGAFSTTDSFGVASSPDGATWSEVADVSLTAITGIDRAWAPQWFVDEDGSPYVFIAVSTNGGTTFTIYETHPTNAAFTTWSSPVNVGIGTNYIDAFVVRKGQFYYLWVKNETTKFIEVFRSASLTSGYSSWKTGDWAGWGDELEGESLVRVDANTWRIYLDSYNTSEIYWSESTDDWATWSAKTLVVGPYYMQHPDVHHAGAPAEPWQLASGTRDGTKFLRDDLTWATPSGGGGGALDDLSDVTITSPAEDDQLQYVGGEWVNNNRRWEPVTFNPGTGPEIVFDGSDEIVMTWKDY